MKTKTILVAVMALVVFAGTPSSSDASRGYIINPTTALLFLDFSINATYGDIAIPTMADHTVGYFDRVDTAGYLVESADETGGTIASATDLVLSNATLDKDRYKVAQGQTAQFTLMSIVTFAEPITSDISGRITKLPFWVDGRRSTLHQNQLDELESVTVPK